MIYIATFIIVIVFSTLMVIVAHCFWDMLDMKDIEVWFLFFTKNDIILLYCSNTYNMTTVPYYFSLQVIYLVHPIDEVSIQNIQMYKGIGYIFPILPCGGLQVFLIIFTMKLI